jgi:hypothetical protein
MFVVAAGDFSGFGMAGSHRWSGGCRGGDGERRLFHPVSDGGCCGSGFVGIDDRVQGVGCPSFAGRTAPQRSADHWGWDWRAYRLRG